MLEQPLSVIKGIGEKKAQKLNRLGLLTLKDVLYDYPRRYIDRREVKHVAEIPTGEYGVICARVVRKRIKPMQKHQKELVVLDVTDGYYSGEIVFFSGRFIADHFIQNENYHFAGKVEKVGPIFKMVQPDYAQESDRTFLSVVPIYNATAGITQNDLINVHRQVLKLELSETLPSALRHLAGLMSYEMAMKEIHFPTSREGFKAAKRRLVYEELFFLQLRLFLIKRQYHKPTMTPYVVSDALERAQSKLPFQLTDSQVKVIEDIRSDLQSGFSMNRLVQGDVGSGKTIVAFLSLMMAVQNHKQGILLAPTTLLAEQHYENFQKMFPDIPCCLLTSTVKSAEKKRIKQEIEAGQLKVIIGTHAILQDDVTFNALGLVITDEQHRFGIRQRLSALQKSEKPHALIMSATPIPRTLSLILYGDMDISVIDQMPKGRKPIKTHFVSPQKANEMYDFIEEKLKEGRQAYVICPLIEESEAIDLHSAETVYALMSQRFPAVNVGLIHGKMNPQDKESVMGAFKNGSCQLLVSTTVIEVGIHVSNATVMVIMNAERFGLSQLHQLRGRVGRGDEQSYCFLISEKLSATSKARIETLVSSNDGFAVAEKDLELRGPGEVFGLRQHGIPELKLADIVRNKATLEEVQKHVKLIFEEANMGNPIWQSFINAQSVNLENWFTL